MMIRRNTPWIAIAVCAAAGIVGAQEDGIKLGNMQFHPFVSAELTSDDNVFQTADGMDDIYTELSAGARLNRETDSFLFDSSAWYARRMYDKYDERDADRWGIAGLLRGESDKTFGTLMLDVRQIDDYDQAPTYGSVPSGFEGTVDAAFDRTVGNEPRRIYESLVGAGYLLSDAVSIMGGYSFYAVDYYDGSTTLDGWIENSVGLEASAKVTDKAVLLLNGQVGVQSGDGAPFSDDAELMTIRVGAKNKLTDKSTLRAAVGATHYKTSMNDYTEPSFDLNGLWTATEKLTVFVYGRNEIQPVGNGTSVKMTARGSTGINFAMNSMLSMVLSGSMVYDRYLDDTTLPGGQTGKPESTILIGTFRINVTPVKRVQLFGQVEATDAQQELSDDYQRLRLSAGLGYAF